MSRDALSTLGQTINSDFTRDAVHVAVFPAYTEDDRGLNPGDHVGFDRWTSSVFRVDADDSSAIGIVDPFLRAPVTPFKYFWVFLYPNTVQNLHHSWSHPSIPDENESSDDWDDGCRGC